MADNEAEALVVLRAQDAETVLEEVRRCCQVTNIAPPRLAIVLAEPAEIAVLGTLPGVEAVYQKHVPEAFLASLKPSERIFADAWLARQGESKQRRGDRLPWDAPGFLPPDKPPHR